MIYWSLIRRLGVPAPWLWVMDRGGCLTHATRIGWQPIGVAIVVVAIGLLLPVIGFSPFFFLASACSLMLVVLLFKIPPLRMHLLCLLCLHRCYLGVTYSSKIPNRETVRGLYQYYGH